MNRQVRKFFGRLLGMPVGYGTDKAVPMREWASLENQHRLVTRGELLSVLKNLKSLNPDDNAAE